MRGNEGSCFWTVVVVLTVRSFVVGAPWVEGGQCNLRVRYGKNYLDSYRREIILCVKL